jgi:hypothetical protein
MKRAGIYRLKDRILIHPWQLTDMGLGVATEPYVVLPLDVDSAKLGLSARETLNQSGQTVRDTTDWKALAAARLKAAGVKSQKAFQTNASYVCLHLSDKQLLVEPSRNGGTQGDAKGFEALPAFTVALAADLPAADLGNAIRQALQISHEQSSA